VLIAILTLSLTAFSQTGTSKVPTKSFPIPTVKLIIKDLMSGDSAKAQLKLVEQQLVETENKVVMKDSIIVLLRVKETNYQTIIAAQDKKYEILENHIDKVEWKLKKAKVKNTFTSILSGTIMAALALLLITK
jgi:hypothetical protein